MAWIILLTSCRIAGVAYPASDEPIQVSSSDAKMLICIGYAKPTEAPVPAAVVAKRSKPSPLPEP